MTVLVLNVTWLFLESVVIIPNINIFFPNMTVLTLNMPVFVLNLPVFIQNITLFFTYMTVFVPNMTTSCQNYLIWFQYEHIWPQRLLYLSKVCPYLSPTKQHLLQILLKYYSIALLFLGEFGNFFMLNIKSKASLSPTQCQSTTGKIHQSTTYIAVYFELNK